MSTTKDNPRSSGEWKKIRLRILSRDQYTCYYCGDEANQVDHIIPIKDEPSMAFDESNLVSACRRCNLAKGSRSMAVFFERSSTPPVLKTSFSPQTVGIVLDSPMSGHSRPSQP